MEAKRDIGIYMRSIQLEVIVPEEFVWEFMKEFGVAFAQMDTHLSLCRRAVDNYFNHPNGWHVIVTISEREEEKFKRFLCRFGDNRGLASKS